MAISVYDIVEGKWYLELADGELIPCESEAKAKELEDAAQPQLEEYRQYLSAKGMLPRLQTIYEIQD